MPKPSANLSPAQLEIMTIIWEHGEIGVAELWQILSRRRAVARNTVQTTLARLGAKGWLKHRQEGNAFLYSAAQPRRRALRGMMSRLIDSAFGGSRPALVLALLEDEKLSADEARKIRDMIDRAEAASNKGAKR